MRTLVPWTMMTASHLATVGYLETWELESSGTWKPEDREGTNRGARVSWHQGIKAAAPGWCLCASRGSETWEMGNTAPFDIEDLAYRSLLAEATRQREIKRPARLEAKTSRKKGTQKPWS